MGLLTAERIDRPPLALFGERIDDGRSVGGEPTLDDAIVGAWEGLTAQIAVACPLCEAGTLRPRVQAGPASTVDGGCCDRCGVTLV
jgi:hypothetical protein